MQALAVVEYVIFAKHLAFNMQSFLYSLKHSLLSVTFIPKYLIFSTTLIFSIIYGYISFLFYCLFAY